MADVPKFPNSLAYVRAQRKLSLEAAAKAIATTPERLNKYERGELVPTATQYAALEAIYGVSDYLLAGTDEPKLDPLLFDFRKEVGAPAEMSPAGLRVYFRARDFVDTVATLAKLVDRPATRRRPEKVSPNRLPELVDALHYDLGFNPGHLSNVGNPDGTFRWLRFAIEQYGVSCLAATAKQSDFRGLYSESYAPFIIINKKTFRTKARLFTLLHEFAHFLLGQQGVSDPFITQNDIERRCNSFASEFLSPDAVFSSLYKSALDLSDNVVELVNIVSNNSLLSKGAVAWRLRLEGKLSRDAYVVWRAAVGLPSSYGEEDGSEDAPEDDESRGGGNYALNVVSDLGYEPILTTKAALEAGLIDDVDAGRLLNARGSTLERVLGLVDGRIQGFIR